MVLLNRFLKDLPRASHCPPQANPIVLASVKRKKTCTPPRRRQVQRVVNLQEVFSFHACDGTTVQDTPHDETEQDMMMTDETFPIYDDSVADALSHTGNEFARTPDRELMTLQVEGECFELGRGDCFPTTENRKKNSEDTMYFHPVRLPCQIGNDDTQLSMERRLSTSWQREAASPFSIGNIERRPTKRVGTILSPTAKPRRYQCSRMRTFNREFGYRKRKHPVSCRLSDIRRWIPDDKKDCRTSSTGSSNDRTRGENLESYAPDIELLSSTTDLTGAQKPPFLHLKLETLPGDSQEDAGRHDFVHKPDRLPLLAANDQGELPDNACPPLFRHDDKFYYNGTVLSPTPCETDKRGRHYIDDGRDVGVFQPVVVQPTRPPLFPFNAYEERCVCSKEGDTSDNGLPPGIERPRHADVAEEEPSITLNESADLFPDESQRSTQIRKQLASLQCNPFLLLGSMCLQ